MRERHRRLLHAGLFASLLLACSVVGGGTIEWTELPELPVEHGFGGPAVGTHQGALVLAGGANFPSAPPWQGGEKVWYDDLWVLDLETEGTKKGEALWQRVGALPNKLAYAASLSTPEGVLVIGGDDGITPNDQVLRLSFQRHKNSEQNSVTLEELPALPRPTTFAAAALAGRRVFVAAGRSSMNNDGLYKAFWSLDLDDLAAGWVSHEPYPGPPRIKMVAAAQSGAVGGSGPSIFLFSGEAFDGALDYRREAYSFSPESGSWREVAPLAQPIAAGSAVATGDSHIVLLSGSSGRFVELPVEERPFFPRTVLAYHTLTDSYSEVGELPEGVVTTPAFLVADELVVVSGEIRPGVRSTLGYRGRVTSSKRSLGGLNLIVVVVYLALLVVMGVFFSRRNRGAKDFFLAGQRVPWWAAGLSIYATQLSAITFIGAPAITFAGDWVVAPSWFLILVMAPIVIAVFLPFYRRLEVTTAYEYLERRFGLAVRLYGSASFIIFQLARMAVVIFLPALALQAMTGIDVRILILVTGVLATLYTVAGGMEAVIWTDVLQSIVLLGGLLLCLTLVVMDLGGVAPIVEAAAVAEKTRLFHWSLSTTSLATWSIVIGSFLLNFAPYATDQAVIQRYLTTKDEKSAARGIWLNGILSVPFAMLFLCLGTALWLYFKQRPELLELGMQNDQAFPVFIIERLPAGVSGVLIAGILAASMSSLDSSIHSISTAVSYDFLKRFGRLQEQTAELRFARTVVVVVGALATVVALGLASYDIRSLFFFFQSLLGLLSSGVVAIFLLGVFTRRAHSTGVLIGAAAATVALAWATFGSGLNLYIYPIVGIGTGLLVGYLASVVVPGKRMERASGLVWRS